jgi:hypothetical protein
VKLPPFLSVSVALFLSTAAVSAQSVPPQIEQARRSSATDVPSLPRDENSLNSPMPTFAAESPGDDDLGQQVILKSKSVYQPLSLFLGTQADYTSNVGLSEGFEEEDWFWRTTIGATYAPRIGNSLLGNLTVSQEVFRYNKYGVLDFESLHLGAGLSYNLWFLYGINAGVEFAYNRLTADDYSDEVFSNRTLTLTLSRNFILSRAHYFYVISSAEMGWSDPEQAERDEFTFVGGYHVRLARNFELNLLYRLAYYHYTQVDREDLNQTVQLTARYHLTKWLSANASIGGTTNDSDRRGFDYETLNTSVGAFLSWKF